MVTMGVVIFNFGAPIKAGKGGGEGPEARNTKHETRDTRHEKHNTKHETRTSKYETRSLHLRPRGSACHRWISVARMLYLSQLPPADRA